MHPPAFVCESLYRKHPSLRLAWKGSHDPTNADLNQGCFAIVRLYPVRAVGRVHDPLILKEFWDSTLRMTVLGEFHTVRDEKGPIFNRHGGTTPDWDVANFVPVIVLTCDKSYGLTHYDVFSNAVVARSSIVPERALRRERAQAALQEGRDLQTKVEATKDAIVDRVWSAARHHSEASTIMARKHIKSDFGEVEGQAEDSNAALSMSDYFVKKQGLDGDL